MGTLKSENEIKKTIANAFVVLKKGGSLILGLHHPNFDHYMRAGLFQNRNVKTKFEGYFSEGNSFALTYQFGSKKVMFLNKHWTLKKYLEILLKARLILTAIDECPPNKKLSGFSKQKIKEKFKYPTYLVVTAQK